MRRELQKRVVQVFQAGPNGRSGNVATGFAVSPSRILTCAHVLAGEADVKVRFLDLDRDRWFPAKPVWNGCGLPGEALDVAVLEIDAQDFLEKVASPSLDPRAPGDRAGWVSRGVPQAANTIDQGDVVSHVVDFGGTLYAPARDGTMNVVVDDPPAHAEDWAGASGSPILIDEDRLVGVITDRRSAWGGIKLDALWTGGLLGLPGFKEALGIPDGQDRVQELVNRVAKLLNDPSQVGLVEAIASNLEPKVPGWPTVVAKALSELQIGQLLSLANRLHASMFGEDAPHPSPKMAKELEKVVDTLLPVGLTARATREAEIMVLPCATMTIAEIHMARLDGRPSEFQSEWAGDSEPFGRYMVDRWPAVGFGERDGAIDAVLQHLITKLGISKSLIPSPAGRCEKAAVIDQVLRRRAAPDTVNPRHYYFLFYDDNDRQYVAELARLLENLRVSKLDPSRGSSDATDKEPVIYDALVEYLQRKHRRENPS